MDQEEKGLVEKKPSLFKRIFYFLFIDSSLEEDEQEELEDGIELEEIGLGNSNKDPEEKEEEYEDDISDYTEELQKEYEEGKCDLGSMTENEVNLLFTLYMNQVEELSKSNEAKKQKLLEYRDSMKK